MTLTIGGTIYKTGVSLSEEESKNIAACETLRSWKCDLSTIHTRYSKLEAAAVTVSSKSPVAQTLHLHSKNSNSASSQSKNVLVAANGTNMIYLLFNHK